MGNRIVSNNLLSALIEVDENSDGNVLTDNVTRGARRREGAYGSRGVRLVGASRTLFRGNRISGAPLGISVETGADSTFRRNVVDGDVDPTFTFSEPDGFQVHAAATGTLLQNNG